LIACVSVVTAELDALLNSPFILSPVKKPRRSTKVTSTADVGQ